MKSKVSGDMGIVADAVMADDGKPVIVAECWEDLRRRMECAGPECAANARRLVACWNALLGVDTDFIERVTQSPGVTIIEHLQRDRAELIEVLRESRNYVAMLGRPDLPSTFQDKGAIAVLDRIDALLARLSDDGLPSSAFAEGLEVQDVRALCDLALKGLASSEQGKLTKHAQIGNCVFHPGVSERLVVERAQREYEYQNTPEKEAERLAKLRAFREAISNASLGPVSDPR